MNISLKKKINEKKNQQFLIIQFYFRVYNLFVKLVTVVNKSKSRIGELITVTSNKVTWLKNFLSFMKKSIEISAPHAWSRHCHRGSILIHFGLLGLKRSLQQHVVHIYGHFLCSNFYLKLLYKICNSYYEFSFSYWLFNFKHFK